MAYFHATGVIATDLVRRETKRGVLASFRLVTATPGTGRLWITAEAWGHTAGILNTHGTTGRGVAISGRLTYNTWRDRSTGAKRSTLVVTIADLDFLDQDIEPADLTTPNHVLAIGKVQADPTSDASGERLLLTLVSGQAGSKTGRLWLPLESWGRTVETAQRLRKGDQVTAAGALRYRTRPDQNGEKVSGYELSANNLTLASRPSVISRSFSSSIRQPNNLMEKLPSVS